jgi:transposase
VSWPTAHAAFVDHAGRLLAQAAAPQVLGIAETRPAALEPQHRWQLQLSGSGGRPGQTTGRTAKSIVTWLDERGQEWKAQVRFVAIDPWATYRTAVEHALPHARVIADHFHLGVEAAIPPQP